jgi:diguanylate cyclase (GGDEF)-like protein
MQKELSVFKSTILLYVMVALLPFGFYFIHDAFDTIQTDTKVLAKVYNINNDRYKLINPIYQRQTNSIIKDIDNNLHYISLWVQNPQNQKYYIGASSLISDFRAIEKYLNRCKLESIKNNQKSLKKLILYNHKLDDFATVIEKMVYIKQDSIINVFYISLAILIILVMLSIYLIRLYIEYQINKNSIYDSETNLYNHDYLMEHLKTTCARATRYKYPLSLLSISLREINLDALEKDEYKRFMETIGDMLLSLTRTSDVACRYNKNHIAIILPFTEKENAQILMSRIQETFEKQDFGISQDTNFVFSILQYTPSDTSKEYIRKAEELLNQ